MLKFFKHVFGSSEKKELPKEEQVRFGEIREWFNNAIKEDLLQIESQLKEHNARVAQIISETKSLIAVLEAAKLKNEAIPQRAKDIMEGNRKIYMKKTSEFLDSIRPAEKPEDIEAFAEEFDKSLQALNAALAKSYFVLQEFFANESKNIALKVKEIEENVKEQKSMLGNSKFGRICRVNGIMQQYNTKAIAKKHVLSTISQLEQETDSAKEQQAEVKKNLEDLKNSEAYAQYHELIAQKEQVEAEAKVLEREFSDVISGLEPALRKFQRLPDALAYDRLISGYLDAPMDALLADTEQKLQKVCAALSALLGEDKLDLKDKRKEKALECIKRINANYLLSVSAKHKELEAMLHAKKQDIMKNASMQDYTDLDYKLNHINARLEQTLKEIEELKKSGERIDLASIKSQLQDEISSCLSRKVVFA
jgi:hypothetical protein